MSYVELKNVCLSYQHNKQAVPVFRDFSLGIERGEFVALMGPSGSGKSTLLRLVSGLEVPAGGEVWVDGLRVDQFSTKEADHFRNLTVGFVFQSFNLIECFTALENVMAPLLIAGVSKPQAGERAGKLLEELGVAHRAGNLPSALSGGEQQRVAIARALANNPDLILADEPTGNLDTAARDSVLSIFRRLNAGGKTLLMVTHDQAAAAYADRTVELPSLTGAIAEDHCTL